MKALVGAFNPEKAIVSALVGAFSVIVKIGYETDGSFYSTNVDLDSDQMRAPWVTLVTRQP